MEIPDLDGVLAWLGPLGPEIAAAAGDLGTLPAPMQAWLVWLAVVTVVWPLLLIRNRVAVSFLALTLPALALQALIYWRLGLTRLLAVPHLILWFPALMLLLSHRQMARDALIDGGPRRTVLRLWMAVAAATPSISLVFDVRDALAWLYGADRPYGSAQIDLGPLIEAGERLLTPAVDPETEVVVEPSGLEAPAAAEGAPADEDGDGGAGGEDREAEGR